MTTPRFEKPARGKAWAPGAKALVIVVAEEAADWADFITRLEAAARWVRGRPSDRTLRTWTNQAGLDLPAREPDAGARASVQASHEARLDRLAAHRATISDALGSKAVPRAVDLLVRRLEEQDDVEERIATAKGRLDEALIMQRAAMDDDEEAKKAARRETVLARLLLALEKEDRIAIVDLMRIVTHGIARHLELEGIGADAAEDPEANPLIVELRIPRPDPNAAPAVVVPAGQLPERTTA